MSLLNETCAFLIHKVKSFFIFSHLLRRVLNNNYKTVDLKDFKIIDSSYHNINDIRFKKKVSEAFILNNTNHL